MTCFFGMRLCKHAKSLKSTKTFRTNYQFYFSLQSINDESKYGEFFDKAESVSETLLESPLTWL